MTVPDDPKPPEVPKDVLAGDVFGTIERLKRESGRFSCLGMGCGSTVLTLIVIAAATYLVVRSMR